MNSSSCDSALTASEVAARELREALEGVGVVLPSLGIDLVSCTCDLDPRPLVDLGRCSLDTAHRLVAIARKAAGR